MQILLVGDLHFGIQEHNDNFFNYQFDCINWLYDEAANRNIKEIVFLGDIFDKRKSINLKVLNKVYNEFLNEEFNHYFILGNHDTFYKNSNTVNSLQILFNQHNIITNIPKQLKFGNKSFLFVPWINKENYDICYDMIQNSNDNYICAHFDLAGFEMTKGFLSKHSSVPISSLKNFDKVFSGHYHGFSQKDNITYVGSLCELNWNDYNIPKVVGILDTETDEVEYIKNPNKFFKKIKIRHLEDLENIDIEEYRLKNIKIYLYIERNIKIEKFISEIIDIADTVNVIDEKIMNTISDVELDIKKMEIDELWSAYIDELDVTKKEKGYINKIFFDAYDKVQRGDLDDEL